MAKKRTLASQQYEIVPHEGIGPVRLGMTRKAVTKAMAGERGATPAGSYGDCDYFFDDQCLLVVYSRDQKVDYIEARPSDEREFWFDEVNVHKLLAKKLLGHISQHDAPHPGGKPAEDAPFFPKLVLSLGQRQIHPSRWARVGIGSESYREYRLRKFDRPFEQDWSGRDAVKAEQDTVEWVARLGGRVAIDEKRHVRRVSIPHNLIDLVDDDFKQFAKLKWLEALETQGQKEITNTAIHHIRGLTRLKALRISATNLDDGMVGDLVRLTSLVELALPTISSATSLKKLAKLTELGNLSLELQRGAEEGLAHLKRLPNLHTLRIRGAVTNKGARHLEDYPRLTTLVLEKTKVTPAATSRLRQQRSSIQLRVFR